MNRLTKRTNGRAGFAGNGSPTENMCKVPTALDRLAAYEDTGLEPEEVVAALHRTAEHDTAMEEGWLVELPCKVGDMVYEVNLSDEFAEVCEYEVQDVSTKEMMFCDEWYPLAILGKTVFLTRSEAEAALGGGECGI